MKRRILATATLAAVIGLAASPAAEAAVSGVGWWTRNPTASAPEGGLQVANAPDGVISFGAVRVSEDGDDIESGVLTLQETEGLNAAGAALQACPAAGTWDSGKGTLADGPKADCQAGSVPLTRNDAGQWTADVTSVLTDTSAVAVVPAADAGVFQVTFAAPKLDVVSRAASGSSSGSSTSDFDTSEFTASPTTSSSGGSEGSGSSESSTFEPSSGSSFSPSSFVSSSDSAASFAPVSETAAPAPDAAAALDAAAVAEDDTASGSTFVARPAAAPPLEVGGNRWAQYGLFLAVAAVIGTVAGVGRNRLTARSA